MRTYHGYFEKGHTINNGRKHSPEVVAKRLITLKITDPDGIRYRKAVATRRKNIGAGIVRQSGGWNKGGNLTPEWAKRIGKSNAERHFTSKIRNEIREMYMTDKMTIQEIANKIGAGRHSITRRLKEDGVTIRGASCLKGGAHTDEHTRKCLRRRIPTSLEDRFSAIIKKHGLPYKFTGDGSFIIAGKNPDFININGQKIAIEVFAEFYKKLNGRNIDTWREERKRLFREYGWELLFFSEKEVTEKNILNRLVN